MNTPNDRILHACEDLAWLSEKSTNFDGTEQDLRHASPIVRRLLLDAGLQQARKLAGATGQPLVEHFPLTQYASTPSDFTNIGVALSMGFRLGARHFGPVVMTVNQPGDDEDQGSAPHQMVRERLPVTAYLKSTCAAFREHQVSRRELIKYIANSDGGAHHGTKDKNTPNPPDHGSPSTSAPLNRRTRRSWKCRRPSPPSPAVAPSSRSGTRWPLQTSSRPPPRVAPRVLSATRARIPP